DSSRHARIRPSSLLFCSKCRGKTYIYTPSLHDALPIYPVEVVGTGKGACGVDLEQVEALFLGQRRVRPADMHAVLGQLEVQRDRSEEHTSELQSRENLVCRLLLEKKNKDTVLIT